MYASTASNYTRAAEMLVRTYYYGALMDKHLTGFTALNMDLTSCITGMFVFDFTIRVRYKRDCERYT